jgi:hypothetical protein
MILWVTLCLMPVEERRRWRPMKNIEKPLIAKLQASGRQPPMALNPHPGGTP